MILDRSRASSVRICPAPKRSEIARDGVRVSQTMRSRRRCGRLKTKAMRGETAARRVPTIRAAQVRMAAPKKFSEFCRNSREVPCSKYRWQTRRRDNFPSCSFGSHAAPAPADSLAGVSTISIFQRRCPKGKPRLNAFCRSAPTVRFIAFAIFFSGDLVRECAFSSRRSAVDQLRRLARRASLVTMTNLLSRIRAIKGQTDLIPTKHLFQSYASGEGRLATGSL
jgi:hypothetical protein